MIEQRKNLLGAWAIHCDTPACHIECLGISEVDVTDIATAGGWTMSELTHNCPDCTAGNSPAAIINESLPSAATPGAPAMQTTPDHVEDLDEDDDYDEDTSQESASLDNVEVTLDGEDSPELTEAFQAGRRSASTEGEKRYHPDGTEAEKFVPFEERSGATIPDVVTRVEDQETPVDKEKRLKREKRSRQRLEDARKQSKGKTLAAMGGVNDLLDDFDSMFGGSKTTWDD